MYTFKRKIRWSGKSATILRGQSAPAASQGYKENESRQTLRSSEVSPVG